MVTFLGCGNSFIIGSNEILSGIGKESIFPAIAFIHPVENDMAM
jgi:hypothetical protein